MIEIERTEIDGHGTFRWHVRGGQTGGVSREPLLDACRVLKSMGTPDDTRIGLFRPGRSDWDLRTTVGYGAKLTVKPGSTGTPRFARWSPGGKPPAQ